MKLDFIVGGFPKCGTTTLCSVLDDHPGVVVSSTKEPNFFVHHYEKGWSWFDALFEGEQPGQLRGEGSTLYSSGNFGRQACERIVKDCPDVRLIFMVRNPVSRAEAAFRELHNTSYYAYRLDTPFTFTEAIEKRPGFVENSLYWRNINVYREHFGDDSIHITFLEDFSADPVGELTKCVRFIGADASIPIPEPRRRLNAGSGKYYDAKMLRQLRRFTAFKKIWNRLDLDEQNRIGKRLRLRKKFEGAVQWEPETRRRFVERIIDDSSQLLAFCGKDDSFWNLAAWLETDQAKVA